MANKTQKDGPRSNESRLQTVWSTWALRPRPRHSSRHWRQAFPTLEIQLEEAAASREGAGFQPTTTVSRCPKPRQRRGEAVGPAPVGVRPTGGVRSPPKVCESGHWPWHSKKGPKAPWNLDTFGFANRHSLYIRLQQVCAGVH
jgi:hypothetical protein